MADIIHLKAEQRTEFGKGAARRIRRDDKVPAVMYGHDHDPIHVTLDGHATLLALRTENPLLSMRSRARNLCSLCRRTLSATSLRDLSATSTC